MNSKKILILSGPTASGKSSLAISLAIELSAKGLPTEIVNFDSLLFYKELNIGTAKPTKDELEKVSHHLINISSISSPISASQYSLLASKVIENLFKKGKFVILTGGSAFYLRALIKGMYQSNPIPPNIQEEVINILQKEGKESLYQKLEALDPISASDLHVNDSYRVSRALEFFKANEYSISEEKKRMEALAPYDFSQGQFKDWSCYHAFLDLPKDEHFKRIVLRTNLMMEQGLISEVRQLLNQGFTGEERPLSSIGYKEVLEFLDNKISSQEECAEKISISTRQLAKAQRTFFKKITPKRSYHPEEELQKLRNDVLNFTIK